MGLKRKIVNAVIKTVIKVLALNKANKFSCAFAELFNPIYRLERLGETFLLACPNEVTRWRAETFFTKEPETIEWIDTFKAGDVLFDIGANVGLYSIYAARKGARVLAFEPESQNYALLNKNVYLNGLQDRITCLNIALSEKDELGDLYIPNFQAGGAINCFGKALDENGQAFRAAFKQGTVSHAVDAFLSRHPLVFPTHIKIDVDGIEIEIIKGAGKTLSDPRLKSLSLEINESLPNCQELVMAVQSKGFLVLHKKHAAMFDHGKYAQIFNYVFIRGQ